LGRCYCELPAAFEQLLAEPISGCSVTLLTPPSSSHLLKPHKTKPNQTPPQLCSAIPKGRVSTYGDLARALDPPSSARAVGQAMRRNPFAPTVPCHRVVAADLQLGGFTGSWGASCQSVQKKRRMLEGEGVLFQGERVGRQCVVKGEELARLAAGGGRKK